VSVRKLVRQDRRKALALWPEELGREVHPAGKRDAHGNGRTLTVRGRIHLGSRIHTHCYRMREAPTMYGLNPCDGVWEQRHDFTSILLGAWLIVHQFVIEESW
jgi:hypothetical protein